MRNRIARALSVLAAALIVLVGLLSVAAGIAEKVKPARADYPGGPAVIEIVGDSITVAADVPGGWRDVLAELIQTATGSRPRIVYYAAGGWSTAQAQPGFPASMAAWNPDLVLLALGTNDQWDTDGAQQRTQVMIGTVKDWQQQHATQLGVSFISYSVGPHVAFQPAEAAVNDALYRAYNASGLWASPAPSLYAGLADMQALGADCFDAQGVHPNAKGYDSMGHLWYNALRARYGWPALPWTPQCAMSGHRP